MASGTRASVMIRRCFNDSALPWKRTYRGRPSRRPASVSTGFRGGARRRRRRRQRRWRRWRKRRGAPSIQQSCRHTSGHGPNSRAFRVSVSEHPFVCLCAFVCRLCTPWTRGGPHTRCSRAKGPPMYRVASETWPSTFPHS